MTDGADVVIVGGGAAGCVVAARIAAGTSASVLLLEAGPADDPPADFHDGWRLPKGFDWDYASEPDERGVSEPLRRMRRVGGTSWLTRFGVRGSTADFDGWAARGLDGWAFDDVLPWFRKLEADLDFRDTAWHGSDGPVPITRYPDLERTPIHQAAVNAMIEAGIPVVEDHNQPGAVGVGPMPMTSRAGHRVTTLDAYLAPRQRPANLAIRGGSIVDAVELEGGRATGVRLADGSRLSAGRVVICAGTYGSPAILLRSGIGPPADLGALGIPVVADLPGVGSNLADHPGADVDVGWDGPMVESPVLHSIATFHSSMTPARDAPDLMFWVADPRSVAPGFTIDTVLLKPRSRGSVRLRSADPGDAPMIQLPGVREPGDVDRLVEGLELGFEVANASPLRDVRGGAAPAARSRNALRAYVETEHYSVPHVVGTCAMGTSPAAGAVVDGDGSVHGVTGLSVIDASIIPEAPSGFPHLITIMLAERLSARSVAAP
jgi:choline dehydrogenase